MTHPSRTHRKYPPPTKRERWELRALVAGGIVLAAGYWYLKGWEIWRGLAWLFR